jgi:UDP-2,3-diacylglucosamine hydrolase
MPQDSIYFMADAHFSLRDSDAEREKRRRFRNFLVNIRGADHLYIVGDLFDFWFEYRRVVPRGFVDLLFPLKELIESGTGVTLIGGNHDYWLGDHLRDEIGLNIAPDGLTAEHQGRRILLVHGDETLTSDHGYLLLKKIIRNPLFITAARWLHPDFTFWAADRLSGGSRHLDQLSQQKGNPGRPLRLSRILDHSFDSMILGHLHIGFHYHFQRWEVLCLGDWIYRFSFVRLTGGKFSLEDDRGNSYPMEEVEDPDRPPEDFIRP